MTGFLPAAVHDPAQSGLAAARDLERAAQRGGAQDIERAGRYLEHARVVQGTGVDGERLTHGSDLQRTGVGESRAAQRQVVAGADGGA